METTKSAIDEHLDSSAAALGPKLITIIVEVNGKNKELKVDHSPITGAEIRREAGVPSGDDLTRLKGGKPVGGNIGPQDSVEIKNGDHFLAAPSGTVS